MIAFVLLASVVCTFGAPVDEAVTVDVQPIVEILSKQDVLNEDGSFNYSYESANGIKVEESGYIKKNPNAPLGLRSGLEGEEEEGTGDIRVVQGSFSYTAPDGTVITLRYTADENGFHPEGDHLPVAPAIPLPIQRSINLVNSEVGLQERSGKSVKLPQQVASEPEQVPSRPEETPSQPEEQSPSQPEEAASQPEEVASQPEEAASPPEEVPSQAEQELSQPDPTVQTPVEN